MFVLAIAALSSMTASQEPTSAPTGLVLTLAADKASTVIGGEVQLEVTLANGGDKDVEIVEPSFDERSLSFEIAFDAGSGKRRKFAYAVIRTDPHLLDRLPPPRVTLQAKRSVGALVRMPALRTGTLSIQARYQGDKDPVRSAAVTVQVEPTGSGEDRLAAILDTSEGKVQVNLLPEEAPNGVANFVNLARRGFYENMLFFRVVKDGWIQSGCPYDNGYGGPGHAVRSEAKEQQVDHDLGTVSLSGFMKNDYAGSQFFICLRPMPSFNKKFTVIGKVHEAGLETVKKIGTAPVDKTTDRPTSDVRLNGISILAVKG